VAGAVDGKRVGILLFCQKIRRNEIICGPSIYLIKIGSNN
jgi:hypothetical protein